MTLNAKIQKNYLYLISIVENIVVLLGLKVLKSDDSYTFPAVEMRKFTKDFKIINIDI